jgi:hypothetical protein
MLLKKYKSRDVSHIGSIYRSENGAFEHYLNGEKKM